MALAGLVLLPSLTGLARAQDPISDEAVEERVQLFGEIVDRRTGEPIPIAAVTLRPPGDQLDSAEPVWSGQSDEIGRFQAGAIPVGAYQLNVIAVPFSRLTYTLILAEEGVVDVRIEMVGFDYQLEPVVASARRMTQLETRGFYERRRVGLGHFVDREDIDSQMAVRVSDLFRSVPGARVIPGRGNSTTIVLRGGCTPLFVLDGSILARPVALDTWISVNGLEGIEVYHAAAAPVQYTGRTTCGVVMLWSRDPLSLSTPRELSWKRILAAVGIGALIVLDVLID
jgi:hypothetical protein